MSLNVPLLISVEVEHSFQNPNTFRHNLFLTRKCLVWTLNFSSEIIFSQCHLIMTRPPDIHIMCLPAGCWGQTGGLSLPAPSPIPRASAWTNTHNQFVWPCSSWYVLYLLYLAPSFLWPRLERSTESKTFRTIFLFEFAVCSIRCWFRRLSFGQIWFNVEAELGVPSSFYPRRYPIEGKHSMFEN